MCGVARGTSMACPWGRLSSFVNDRAKGQVSVSANGTCGRINSDGLAEWIPPRWIGHDQRPQINARIRRLNAQHNSTATDGDKHQPPPDRMPSATHRLETVLKIRHRS